ncbi:hypothetical protein EBESD8_21330 [Rhodococcus aetherivorans]|nr:hypothetical protein EBESD8_21330 [Rhodococcus aetherivorans]
MVKRLFINDIDAVRSRFPRKGPRHVDPARLIYKERLTYHFSCM